MLFQHDQSKAIWLLHNLFILLKFLFQNENIKIISKIVYLKIIYSTILTYIMFMLCFTTKFRGFTKILKMKICVLNFHPVHAAIILNLPLEIMLSPRKWETKHRYNSKGFSFVPGQVYLIRTNFRAFAQKNLFAREN